MFKKIQNTKCVKKQNSNTKYKICYRTQKYTQHIKYYSTQKVHNKKSLIKLKPQYISNIKKKYSTLKKFK